MENIYQTIKFKIEDVELDINYSPEDKYVETLIQGHIIKVHDVLGILKEKYQMGRKKDLLFNFTMQNTMNDMFLSN